jgi:hypothetical protein
MKPVGLGGVVVISRDMQDFIVHAVLTRFSNKLSNLFKEDLRILSPIGFLPLSVSLLALWGPHGQEIFIRNIQYPKKPLLQKSLCEMFVNLRLLACISSNNKLFPVPGNNAVLWRFQTHAQDKGVNMAAKLRRKEKLHQFSTMFNTEFHVNFNQLCFTILKVILCNIVCMSHSCDILNQY